MRENVTRGITLLMRTAHHPTWAAENIRNFLYQREDARGPQHIGHVEISPLEVVLPQLTGCAVGEVREYLRNAPKIKPPGDSVLYGYPDGSSDFVELLYTVCRVMRPQLVVETGVANGFSSAAILTALSEDERGQLISIDLPHLHPQAERFVGSAVPREIRDRWDLRFGPAAKTLRKSLDKDNPVDIFVQDASHTRRGQLAEYRAVWTFLRHQGLLISDDVTAAFQEFAEEVGADTFYVAQAKSSPIGILRRP